MNAFTPAEIAASNAETMKAAMGAMFGESEISGADGDDEYFAEQDAAAGAAQFAPQPEPAADSKPLSFVDTALELAVHGLSVFPCNDKKEPLTPKGFLDATTNPDIIRKLFSAPAAKMIGVPTGAASGIDVLDFDYRHGAKDWETDNIARLPETRVHQSQSGGRHMLFRSDAGVRNSAGRIAKGIDVRGGGGYIIWPGSPGYTVISEAALAPWPEWLLTPGLVLPKAAPERPISSGAPYVPAPNARFEGYRLSVLKTVKTAAEGQKHFRLRNAALALGGIQDEAGFSDAEAIDWLMDALPGTVADWKAAKKTAAWGLAAGRDEPIKLEDRPNPRGTRPADVPPPDEAAEPAGDWTGEVPPPGDARESGRGQAADENDWPEPLDFLADADMTGAPELLPEHLPEAIAPFVFDTAARMGVDPTGVALAAVVSLASVVTDDWAIQPKQNDDTWTEAPRLWGAIVGNPSILKSPIVKVTTAPIDKMEAEARDRHENDMRRYRCEMKTWKDAGSDPASEPKAPVLDRYLVEGTTTEAISEVLRDDFKATQRAPAGKILIRQDEMSEWIASFDRYRSSGKGGADRGAYLRLYNGGRYTIDRVNRGTFAIPNWSACIIGGIQPGPIRQIAKDAADDGLLQRFCYCVPASQGRGEDRKPDAAALARYAALFPALGALTPGKFLSGEAHRVVLHAEAHRHRLDILELTEALAAMPDASDRMKSALGKWPGLWARMTLVFHLIALADARARGETPKDVANVARGAATTATRYLREILLPHLMRADAVMFATEQTGHARWIAGFILSKGGDRIAARDIMRAYGSLRAPEHRRELLAVMESLETMGWVRPATQADGRPPVAWNVNPKVHTGFAERAKRERAERQATKDRIRETLAKHAKQGAPA